MNRNVISRLLASDEPSVRFKVRVNVLGEDIDSPGMIALRKEIKESPRVTRLLSERADDGSMPHHPYSKWRGAHWIMATLADIGYPPGDQSLLPLRERVCDWLLAHRPSRVEGRVRRCASQEGNAAYYLLSLGLADERTQELVSRLIAWQWPDGGWNCDKRPEADSSSFMESLIPLRALALHAKLTGSPASKAAAERAAEVFLKRRLYKRVKDSRIISGDFVRLHYPCYWHYDILFGLKVMAEAGFIGDERCRDALDLLESKRLPDGGFPAEARYYHFAKSRKSGYELVDWGGARTARSNEFVTADALYVLKAAGKSNTVA